MPFNIVRRLWAKLIFNACATFLYQTRAATTKVLLSEPTSSAALIRLGRMPRATRSTKVPPTEATSGNSLIHNSRARLDEIYVSYSESAAIYRRTFQAYLVLPEEVRDTLSREVMRTLDGFETLAASLMDVDMALNGGVVFGGCRVMPLDRAQLQKLARDLDICNRQLQHISPRARDLEERIAERKNGITMRLC